MSTKKKTTANSKKAADTKKDGQTAQSKKR